VRGSDPDAALYWLAKMVYAGEDSRFILRRLLILASEDIGLADPQAVVVVNACAEAFDRIGLPEGRYHLAQATLYLANAPKSNSLMGFFDAIAAVEQERQSDVPNPLKDGNRDKKGFGHGAGYLYPHAYRDHWIEQQYLPSSLQGQVFYQPSDQGAEAAIKLQVERRREAQLAAMVSGLVIELPEILTFSPTDTKSDRWLQRTIGQAGERLATIRDRLFSKLSLQRHDVVLNLNAATGLFTWEALRSVPEGGVYAITYQKSEAIALQEQAASLPEILRPIVMHGSLTKLSEAIASMKFEAIIGYNTLMREPDKLACIQQLGNLLQPHGKIALYESIPKHTQRIYKLINLPDTFGDRWMQAEEAIYANPDDSMTNWDIDDLRSAFEKVGLTVEIEVERITTPMQISTALLNRWFSKSQTKPSYASHLTKFLTDDEIAIVQQLLTNKLLNKTVDWTSSAAMITSRSL
jgi:putative ATPase